MVVVVRGGGGGAGVYLALNVGSKLLLCIIFIVSYSLKVFTKKQNNNSSILLNGKEYINNSIYIFGALSFVIHYDSCKLLQ